jgi:hypothetical protein
LPDDADFKVYTISIHPSKLIFAVCTQANSPSTVFGRLESQPAASLLKDDALLQKNQIKFYSFGKCVRSILITLAIFSEDSRFLWAFSSAFCLLWLTSTPTLQLDPQEHNYSSISQAIWDTFDGKAQAIGHIIFPYSSFIW